MAKVKVSPGDIFEVPLQNGRKQFFQYVLKNLNQLGGNLIRAFDYECEVEKSVDTKELIKKPIKFYTHTMLLVGLKLGTWNKIGSEPIEKNFEMPTFRGTDDVYSMTKKSYKWYIEKGDKITWIGELKDEFKHLPTDGVNPPHLVVRQLETGNDGSKWPE
jgi:hypothetical protein